MTMQETFTVEQRYETQPTANTADAMLTKLEGALHDFVDVNHASSTANDLLATFTYNGHDHKLTIDLDGSQETGFLLAVSIKTRDDIDKDTTREAFKRIESAIGVHFDHARIDH